MRAAGRSRSGWIWVTMLVGAAIVLPFLLFGTALEQAATQAVLLSQSRPVLAITVALLLAADVLLPIPSSVISTLAGHRLGFLLGTAVSTAGMTAGCMLGYTLGRSLGKHIVARLVGMSSLAEAKLLADRVGPSALALLRPVPVLAEASVLLAGATGASRATFLAVILFANVGVSAVYAAAGSWSATSGTLALAFVAAVGIPGLCLLLRIALRRTVSKRGAERC